MKASVSRAWQRLLMLTNNWGKLPGSRDGKVNVNVNKKGNLDVNINVNDISRRVLTDGRGFHHSGQGL